MINLLFYWLIKLVFESKSNEFRLPP